MSKLTRIRQLSPSDFFKLSLASLLLFFASVRILFSSQENMIRDLQPRENAAPSLNPGSIAHLRNWIQFLEMADRNLGWKPSCIRRALVISRLSRAFKIPFQFKIGVRRDGNVFEAHTWLEAEGMTLELQPSQAIFLPLEKISNL